MGELPDDTRKIVDTYLRRAKGDPVLAKSLMAQSTESTSRSNMGLFARFLRRRWFRERRMIEQELDRSGS